MHNAREKIKRDEALFKNMHHKTWFRLSAAVVPSLLCAVIAPPTLLFSHDEALT